MNNTNDVNNDDLNSSNDAVSANTTPTKKGLRAYLPPVLGVIVAVVLLLGLLQLSRNKPPAENTRKEVSLSAEQRQTLEGDVAATDEKIKNLPANAPAAERYQLYIKLASTKYNLGLYEEAIQALDKIKDENQNQPALWQRYALVYRDSGDLAKARENAKRALDLDKTVPQYWLTYIETSANEKTDTVKALYQEALQSTENNIGIITAYAAFLEKSGDKQGSIEQWQKAIEVFPQGKSDYEVEIARLRQ